MYKRIILFSSLFLLIEWQGFAQKNDYVWVNGLCFTGRPNPRTYDSTIDIHLGINIFDFNQSPMKYIIDSFSYITDCANTSICNDSGQLQFYTNGGNIYNFKNRPIEGSAGLNYGEFQLLHSFVYLDSSLYGYFAQQAVLILPSIDSEGQYYLLHSYLDTIYGFSHSPVCNQLRYTLVDMNANAGDGKVLDLNHVLADDVFLCPIAACKQANGRDWWIVNRKRYSSCYEFYTLDKTGIHFSHEQCIGDTSVYWAWIYQTIIFSPDGSKLIFTSGTKGRTVFDFDRCSGILSNPSTLYQPDSFFFFQNYSAVSASSRYLYALTGWHLYQYDLQAADIAASLQLVSTWDTAYLGPYPLDYSTSQLAPDGKIYTSGNFGGGFGDCSVIDKPDLPGASCNVLEHAIRLENFGGGGMPYFPNYRLGRLVGSPCDTLFTDTTDTIGFSMPLQKSQLKISPNPTSSTLIADYGFLDWSGLKDLHLSITNSLGQSLMEVPIPDYSAIQRLDVHALSNGIYCLNISAAGRLLMSGRFVKE